MAAAPAASDNTGDCWHPLCRSADLAEAGEAVPFDVRYRGAACRAFAVRFGGRVYAYLNRCSHVAMELDWLPNRVFDTSGQWLICGAHGALFDPRSGRCVGGPGRGPLVAIAVRETDGWVHWQSRYDLQPLEF